MAAHAATKFNAVATIPFVKLEAKLVALALVAFAVPTAGGVVFKVTVQLLVVLDIDAPVTVTTFPDTVAVPPHVLVKAFGEETFSPAGNV